MYDIHQLPTDTATLVCRIDEYASDYISVEACSASNIFASHGYENLALIEQCANDFRSKTALNLSDNVR
ncbi:hypothetical protein UB47_11900 [Pseudomonas sp. 5]|nr:hypothetical protein UB47_11900 [Pseudomonas sp. 5]